MDRKKHASILRLTRKVHRIMGLVLAVFFLVVSLSGLLLAWKKDSKGIILPKTNKGISTNLADWMPMDSLHQIAITSFHKSTDPNYSLALKRIDARPSKGIVKFVFEEGYHEVQLDATTGEVFHTKRRYSDLIEDIHEGSILDNWFNTEGALKLIYSTIMGLALFLFVVTGMWLWMGPKMMKRAR